MKILTLQGLRSFYPLFLFFFLIVLSHFLYHKLVVYSEKTSYIWYEIENRSIPKKHYDLLIMGDSQIMSGLHPTYLEKKFRKKGKNFEILYYPRPSEQAEGILNTLLKLEKMNITYDRLLANISPVTTSKNTIANAHKSLAINMTDFQPEFYWKHQLNRFYLKSLSQNLYYLVLQVFPLLKLNSNISREIRLLPNNERVNQFSKDLESYINQDTFGNLLENEKHNQFLKKELKQNGFYWEWGNFTKYTGRCQINKEEFELPNIIGQAFLIPRKNAKKSWVRIMELLSKKNVHFFLVYLPFAPTAEKKMQNNADFSPIRQTIQSLRLRFGNGSVIELDKNFFTNEDYTDYTHLNVCGMKKFADYLVELY